MEPEEPGVRSQAPLPPPPGGGHDGGIDPIIGMIRRARRAGLEQGFAVGIAITTWVWIAVLIVVALILWTDATPTRLR